MIETEAIRVPGTGPLDANLALIGEGPGAEEEQGGIPFIGRAGRLLDQCLGEAGINRTECYIDNVVQYRPPENKMAAWFTGAGYRSPNDTVKEGVAHLKQVLETMKPNLVVALGNYALWALTGEEGGITKKRGSLYECSLTPGLKVLATLHPAGVLRMWTDRPYLVADLHRAREEAKFSELDLPEFDSLIDPTFDEVILALSKLMEEGVLSYDIETRGPFTISCIGFTAGLRDPICIPFLKDNKWRWSLEEEAEIWQAIGRLLESDIPKIGQNVSYDNAWLARYYGIWPKNLLMDTMIAHHDVYPEQKKGLDTIASLYTRHPYYKDDVNAWDSKVLDKELWGYNCKDVVVTLDASVAIGMEVREAQLEEVVKFDQSLIEPLTYMQLKGIRYDQEKCDQLGKEFGEAREIAQMKLNDTVGREINPASPKQVSELLFGELGLPPRRDRRTGSLTTKEEALVSLKDHTDSPVLDLIIECRRYSKLISTYINMPTDPIDKRMRTSLSIGATRTGRLGSQSNAWWTGGNLHTIPKRHEGGKRIRGCYIPDEGMEFLEMDLVQAENIYVAYESGEQVLIDAFAAGLDSHAETAALIFGKPVEEIDKGGMERYLGKKIVHASNYGMGPRTFKGELNKEDFPITETECKRLLAKRFQIHAMIPAWHRGIQAELKTTRDLRTVFGRRRLFFERWGDALFREAYAFRPQSTVADLLNHYLIDLYHNCPHIEPLLQVHDSVLMQLKPEHREEVIEWILEHCNMSLEVGGREMRIPLEISVGPSWAEMEEVKV